MAVDGDVIFVTEGVYGPVVTDNKRIRVIATGKLKNTVIDGGGTNRCVFVGQSDTSVDYMPSSSTNSWFVGFTICNGRTDTGGAGVCGGRFDNCLIEHCAGTPGSDYWGGGARFAILNNCVLRVCGWRRLLVGSCELHGREQYGYIESWRRRRDFVHGQEFDRMGQSIRREFIFQLSVRYVHVFLYGAFGVGCG